MSTIFTKIINKEIPAHIVYEDDMVIAFLDIAQANPGHTLVVPKECYANIYELTDNIIAHIAKVCVKLARAIKDCFNCEGMNILNNNGEAAGQSVFHYHVHLIPRYKNDGVKLNDPSSAKTTSTKEFEKRANLIKKALS